MMGIWTDASESMDDAEGDMGKPEVPHIYTGEPQRADGAARNTPPKAFRLESFLLDTGSSSGDAKTDGK
jgi:hypothetical protein